MRQELDKIWIEMKVNIMSYIEQLRFINVCADIWTTRGMTASFLGLTAHFFFLQRSQATQCVRTMPSPHTADNIAKLVKQYLQNGIYLNPKFIACLLIMEKKNSSVAVTVKSVMTLKKKSKMRLKHLKKKMITYQ